MVVVAFVVLMTFASWGGLSGAAPATAAGSSSAGTGGASSGGFSPLVGGTLPRVYDVLSFSTAPQGVAYDSANDKIFVSTSGSPGRVTVIRGTTFGAEAEPIVGKNPQVPIYDSGAGEVFVPNSGSANVSVISTSSLNVTGTVAVGSFPMGGAYVSTQNEIAVANTGASTVSLIADANNTVVKTVNVGEVPSYVAFDSAKDEIFVTNELSGNVSVIAGANGTVVGSINVSTDPLGIVYDAALGELFVANSGSDSVSVISDTNDSVVATIPLTLSPRLLAYDATGAAIYVTEQTGPPGYGGNVTLFGASNRTVFATIKVGLNPLGIAFDGDQGMMYVANSKSDSVSVIAQTYTVGFPETGLPASTTWNVTVSGSLVVNGSATVSTSGSLISFSLPNGSYTYVIHSSNLKYSAPGGGFSVAGAGLTESVTFTLVTFTVTFSETGLVTNPIGTPPLLNWSVTFQGDTQVVAIGRSISYVEPNGTYNYSVESLVNNTEEVYVPSPLSGSVTVNGGDVPVAVHFTLVPLYEVTFREVGLGPGQNWSVTSDAMTRNNTSAGVHNPNASTGSVQFLHANGSINFTFAAPHGYAVVKVTGPRRPTFSTANVSGTTTLVVTFGKLQYVNYTEEVSASPGIPPPSVGRWSVTLTPHGAGENPAVLSANTTGTNLSFLLAKGAAYKFAITGPTTFVVSPSKGAVAGGALAVTKIVRFRPEVERVLVVESGLPRATRWCFNVTGPMSGSVCGAGTTLTTHLVNGTYDYTLSAEGGATFTAPTGNFTITWAKATFVKIEVTGS